MSSIAIILTSNYVLHNKVMKNGKIVSYNKYIDYMVREEVKKEDISKNYSDYNDYMGNPNKNGSLFTKDSLDDDEIKEVKNLFKLAQSRKSNLWQDVFSFNNKWLEKQCLYDSKTKVLDE